MLRKSRVRCKGGVEVLIIVLETRAPGFWLGKQQSKEKGQNELEGFFCEWGHKLWEMPS